MGLKHRTGTGGVGIAPAAFVTQQAQQLYMQWRVLRTTAVEPLMAARLATNATDFSATLVTSKTALSSGVRAATVIVERGTCWDAGCWTAAGILGDVAGEGHRRAPAIGLDVGAQRGGHPLGRVVHVGVGGGRARANLYAAGDRDAAEVEAWREKDPLTVLRRRMIGLGWPGSPWGPTRASRVSTPSGPTRVMVPSRLPA